MPKVFMYISLKPESKKIMIWEYKVYNILDQAS
jgi:hypothetical protein